MRVSVKVEGLKELDEALAQLPKATVKAVLRRVGYAALEPMADTARRLAPDDPKTGVPDLKSSIAVSSKQKSGRQAQRTREGKDTVQVYMGPTKDGYPEAITQEFGSRPHKIRPKRKPRLGFVDEGQFFRPGTVDHPGNPPRPFMRPAWDAHKDEALTIIRAQLGAEIQKTAARIAKRAARLIAKARGQ